MEILKVSATHGPNYWSLNRPNLIVMHLDIGALEYQPTNEIKGFYQRLKKLLPGLYNHYCSEGVPGGFFSRVQRGTWMAHVVEHIALELQTLAGCEVGFGRARGSGTKGRYQVVFDYEDEECGRIAARRAVAIATNLIAGNTSRLKTIISELKAVREANAPGPSTASILKEAHQRNIPVISLNEDSLYQLGYGIKQKRFAATIASSTSQLAVDAACNKITCRNLLEAMGLPMAPAEAVGSKEELLRAVSIIGFPLVVKPSNGNHGRGITTNICGFSEARRAYRIAREISREVIVERFVDGADFRLLVVNYRFVAAARRTPAHVSGDGHTSIRELIKKENLDPRRGQGHEKVLTRISLNRSSREILKRKGYTLNTVLAEGEILYLNHAANLSAGGTATDVTASVHPAVRELAERVARIMQLDICGIDVLAPDLKTPFAKNGGVILEVNAAPGFRMHLAPSSGNPINVAAPVLEMLFPYQQDGRIPIVAVTGTNGKTTTTRLIAHILKTAGRQVGYCTTDGIYIHNELIMKGDCTGPRSAALVLRDPGVETAVLECARGGLLRSGLAFDRCDVGVVTNVTSDHLGLEGINTLEKMARLKGVIPESVAPNGHAILNADDDLVYAMHKNLSCRVVLISQDAANERILAHRGNGGICVVNSEGFISIFDQHKSYRLEAIEKVPLSFKGTARFMVENLLAAVAAAYVQEVSLATIKSALMSFIPSPHHTPGRMNLFHFKDFDVIIDYAHNPAGLLAIRDFLNNSSYHHKVGIVAAIGDRRVEDSVEVGRLAAETFDEVIIREDSDLRGRLPGELTEMIKSGIAAAARSPKVSVIPDEKEALNYAIQDALPGSVIILCTENVSEVLEFIKANHREVQQQQLKHQIKHTEKAGTVLNPSMPSSDKSFPL